MTAREPEKNMTTTHLQQYKFVTTTEFLPKESDWFTLAFLTTNYLYSITQIIALKLDSP